MEQVLRWEPLEGLSPAKVDEVHDGVAKVLSDAGLGRATCFAATVVVEELCTNIMEHSGARWMEVALSSAGRRARILIRDNGQPFDPCEAIRAHADSFDLKEVVDRRLGLYMVRRLTESFHCGRDSQGCNLIEFEIGRDLEEEARSGGGQAA